MQTSCKKDFLDRAPQHTYAADNYYASDDAVLKAVEPLYNRAWFFYNNTCTLGLGSQRANDAWNPYNMAELRPFPSYRSDGSSGTGMVFIIYGCGICKLCHQECASI